MNIRTFNLVLGIIFSGLSLVFFISVIPTDFLQALKEHKHAIIIISAMLIPVYLLRSLKYFLILKTFNLNFYHLAATQFAGIALNNVLPFRMGDILRTGYLRLAMQVPLRAAIGSLITERAFDLAVILSLLSIFIAFFFSHKLVEFILAYSLDLAAVFLISLILLTMTIFIAFFSEKIQKFILGLRAFWTLDLQGILRVLSITIVQWFLEIVVLGAMLSMLVFDDTYSIAILSAFFCNLSTLLPSAPGYAGTFEAAGILPFIAVDFPNMKDAASFVLILHASIWLFSTVLGIASMVAFRPIFYFFRNNEY